MIQLRKAAGTAQETVLTVAALLGSVAILAATLGVVFDLRVLAFESGSMSPTISTGALAVARSVPAEDLHRGDVVSVLTESGSRVTHRIVEIEPAGDRALLRLQGDDNQVPDAASYPVRAADRVVFSVPLLGYAGSALASPIGLVGLGALALFLVAVLVRESRRPRHRGARSLGAVVAVGALAVAVPAVLTGRVDTTLAAWTDPVTVKTGAFTTATVPAPVPTCGALAFWSVRLNWAPVPGATSYTVYQGVNGNHTIKTTATSVPLTAAYDNATAWVVAHRDFGGTVWTSAPSQSRSYFLGDPSTCR